MTREDTVSKKTRAEAVEKRKDKVLTYWPIHTGRARDSNLTPVPPVCRDETLPTMLPFQVHCTGCR